MADDAYSNNFTVTIDQSVTVLSIRNTAGTVAVAGGTFNVTVGGMTLTATGAGFVSGPGVLCTFNASGVLTTNGTVTGGTSASVNNATINVSGGGTLNHTGNVTAGSGAGAYGIGVLTTVGATINVVGNVTGGTINGASGVNVPVGMACNVFILGTVTGGSVGTTSYGVIVNPGTFAGNLQIGTPQSPQPVVGGNASAVIWSSAGSLTIYGQCSAPGTAIGVAATAATPSAVVTINGDSTAVTSGSVLSLGGVGTFTVNGNLTAVQGVPLTSVTSLGGTLTVTGNITGGTLASTNGMTIAPTTNTLTVNVIGNVTGGSSTGHGVSIAGTSPVTLNLTGNCIGGSASSACGLSYVNAATATVFGDAVGGTLAANYGIAVGTGVGTGPVTLWGTARGSNTGTGAGNGMNIGASTNCFAQVLQGNNYPNDGLTVASVGVTGTNASGAVLCDAMVDGSGGYPGTQTVRSFLRAAGTNYIQMRDSNLGTTLTLGEATDYPVPTNVRNGVAYNFGAQTGTLKVPPVNSVAAGVPVDNTVGTASLTPDALLGPDLLQRMQNCSTVETTGAQLAAMTT